MTNYERICADKVFCAMLLADVQESGSAELWMKWLDTEQREVEEATHDQSGL